MIAEILNLVVVRKYGSARWLSAKLAQSAAKVVESLSQDLTPDCTTYVELGARV